MQNVSLQRLLFSLLLLSLFSGQQRALAQSRQRWSFGPRVGLNLSNFVGNNYQTSPQAGFDKNVIQPGISAGVGFIYSDISRFGFAIDLLYSQRGNKIRNATPGSPDAASIVNRVNYLELPLTARYFLTRSGNFRPNLFVGAVPALRLSARQIFSGNGVNYSNDMTQSYAAADVGLTAGFQLNWRAGNRQRFTIDARYTHGLLNVSQANPQLGTVKENDLRNQVITVGLGYNFGIGRNYQPGDRKLPIRPSR